MKKIINWLKRIDLKNMFAYIIFATTTCLITVANVPFPFGFVIIFLAFVACNAITNLYWRSFFAGLIGILAALPILLLFYK